MLTPRSYSMVGEQREAGRFSIGWTGLAAYGQAC
jgi:hypothetical protein